MRGIFFNGLTGKLGYFKYREKDRKYGASCGSGKPNFDEILLLENIFNGKVPLLDGEKNPFKMIANEADACVGGEKTESNPYSEIVIEMSKRFPFFGIYLTIDDASWCKEVLSGKVVLSLRNRPAVERVLRRAILREIGVLQYKAREIKWIINYVLCHILLNSSEPVFYMAKERRSLTFNGKEIQLAIAQKLREKNQNGKLFPTETFAIHHDDKLVVLPNHGQTLDEVALQIIIDYMQTNVLPAEEIILGYEQAHELAHRGKTDYLKLLRAQDGKPAVWTEFLDILELFKKGQYPPVLEDDPLWNKFHKT
ncbi:hypothetical protein A2246_02235 [candidate division WOR-1 bacterium RIFOXYA2_FULL_37_7]|uniref:Uncharacterized protein n=1 Tax=candidate division WOR-1 bacterium RIFOXYB2_FULL_37_13 TaxID=1802579 RepID=A0A1F4STF5_UNCSA|nr:MAG: hypothetical protein A2246_02235 [candidate division WOR-1 bacterium RIFOXYA2_FULL_37_7]OGC23711.1 MAG: hypothetical protein A2310_06800 [candidate division WOR-1 bacterium RIFOXYB2_FULL_37_13]